jgi:hypothetical protein
MQEQKEGEGTAPNPFATSVLERDSGKHHAPATLLPMKEPVPTAKNTGWASEPVNSRHTDHHSRCTEFERQCAYLILLYRLHCFPQSP